MMTPNLKTGFLSQLKLMANGDDAQKRIALVQIADLMTATYAWLLQRKDEMAADLASTAGKSQTSVFNTVAAAQRGVKETTYVEAALQAVRQQQLTALPTEIQEAIFAECEAKALALDAKRKLVEAVGHLTTTALDDLLHYESRRVVEASKVGDRFEEFRQDFYPKFRVQLTEALAWRAAILRSDLKIDNDVDSLFDAWIERSQLDLDRLARLSDSRRKPAVETLVAGWSDRPRELADELIAA
jgi:hypothetical protein